MLEPILVAVMVLAAVAISAVVRSYRRFVEARRGLIEHLRQTAPEMTVQTLTDTGFVVEVLGSEVTVDVATLARRRSSGTPEREWLDQVLDEVRARVPVPQAPPYALVTDRLMPMLKPVAYVTIFDRYPPPLRLVTRTLVADLTVTYVIAGTHQRTLVTAGMIETWNVSLDALHGQAVENLRQQTVHLFEEIGGPKMRYEHLDGSEATRILVADLVVPPDMHDPVIAIPEETVLLIAPATEHMALAAEAAARHADSTRPISPLLFRPGAAGPVPLGESSSPYPNRRPG